MGLLDEAIREHLELKRRRGADPGEVAREEQDALAPVFADDGSEVEDGTVVGDSGGPMPADATLAESDSPPVPAEFAGLGEETAEIDMQAVLEADLHEGHQGDPLAHEALHMSDMGVALDWEMPGEVGRESVPEEIPGQERLTFE